MRLKEEYLVLRDGASTLRLLKLDCHSIRKGRAILRFSGIIEEYEIASVHTHRGEFKDVIEYELGRCIRCIKLGDAVRRVEV